MLRRTTTGHNGLLALAVFLGILMVSASEFKIQLIPPEPQENQTVILTITGITETILFSEWYQGKDINAANQIIRYNKDNPPNNGNKYFNGAEIHGSGSLLIRKVTKDLQCDYTAYIQGSSKSYQQTVFLKVIVPGKNGDTHLGGGAIAGIVIGVISVLAALVTVAVYLLKKKDSGPL